VTLVSKTYWAGMPFWFRRAPEAEVESLVLRAHDMRQLRALWWHRGSPKVGVVVIHPRVDFAHHYSIPRLVGQGFGVLAATARHAGNDTLHEYEEVVLDVAACVRYLREKRGVEKVVLLGNCGGGSLVAYYQAQARLPASERITRTPGGSPTYFEGATTLPADGVVYVAPHRGLGKLMLDAIDPSVVDERDPLSVDPELDMYDPRNGFREPPAWSKFDAAFLARYRAAQRARVERLDAYARDRIASRQTGDARAKVAEEIMVVYRTMANPAFVDRDIEPSERDYGSLLSERPDLMNYAALGFGRTATPRAWLSTWSGLTSNADLVANVARITEPTLLVAAGRDREIYPSDIAAIDGAIAAADKRVETIAAARHYFEPEPGEHDGHVEAMMDLIVPWIAERFA
jgi:alpha-beta hydrolase superfamily lysophospholipase